MPSVFTEGRRSSEFILSEAEGWRSRDHITLAQRATVYESGTPLGVVTATKKFTAWNPTATDGSQTYAGTLLSRVDATASDRRGVNMARACELNGLVINWPVGMTAVQRDALIASAATVSGTIIRLGV